MKIDIYCDESRLEFLESNEDGFMVTPYFSLSKPETEKEIL